MSAHRVARLDHVQLAMPAGEEEAAEAFYCGLLGFEVLEKPPVLAARGGRWFGCDGGRVQVHLGVEEDFRPARKAHPALAVEGLDALAAALGAAGHAVRWDEDNPGVRRCYVEDPFGNRIELVGDGRETARGTHRRGEATSGSGVVAPQGEYCSVVVNRGGLGFVAGTTPRVDGKLIARGRVGLDLDDELVKRCCEVAVDNALAAVELELGDLAAIRQCLRLTVYLACAEDFDSHSRIADFASARLLEALGERGRAARSTVGVESLPGSSPVEVELTFEAV